MALVGALFLLRIVLGFVLLPPGVALVLDFVVTVVFVTVPILAVFRAAQSPWTAKMGAVFVAAGAAAHVLGTVLLIKVLPAAGPATVVVQSLVQAGISFWTLGLGALVAVMIKDKNLILPVAVFLAGLDMFLVFNPDAPTAKIVRQNPAIFQSMAYKVPSARAEAPGAPTGAQVVPRAFIGPADLLFIAAFFVLLTRFKMRVSETVRWLVPVMLVYLALVLIPQLGLSMLPALVPIGGTVLLVNRNEFSMSKEEKGMTWGAIVLAVALAGFGLFRHFTTKTGAAPPEPSKLEGAQGLPGSGATQEPASGG